LLWPIAPTGQVVERSLKAIVLAKNAAWADVVMTGGMLLQQADTLEIVRLAHKHGKYAAVGGPDVTSSPHLYADADVLVLGEA